MKTLKKTKQVVLKIMMLFISFTTSLTLAQTLEENKVDEFTNDSVKRTSWETLNKTMSFTAFYRISRVNDNNFLELKLMINEGTKLKTFSIGKEQEIMFKLENGEVVKLANLEYAITCTGCGARGFGGSTGQGIQVTYLMGKEEFDKLKNNAVVKVRIYTSDGYVEETIKEKNSKKIPIMLKLVE